MAEQTEAYEVEALIGRGRFGLVYRAVGPEGAVVLPMTGRVLSMTGGVAGSGPEAPCQCRSVQQSVALLCMHGCVLLAALRRVLAGVRRGACADVLLREGLGECDGVHVRVLGWVEHCLSAAVCGPGSMAAVCSVQVVDAACCVLVAAEGEWECMCEAVVGCAVACGLCMCEVARDGVEQGCRHCRTGYLDAELFITILLICSVEHLWSTTTCLAKLWLGV